VQDNYVIEVITLRKDLCSSHGTPANSHENGLVLMGPQLILMRMGYLKQAYPTFVPFFMHLFPSYFSSKL
jgi:hypothetical protein